MKEAIFLCEVLNDEDEEKGDKMVIKIWSENQTNERDTEWE